MLPLVDRQRTYHFRSPTMHRPRHTAAVAPSTRVPEAAGYIVTLVLHTVMYDAGLLLTCGRLFRPTIRKRRYHPRSRPHSVVHRCRGTISVSLSATASHDLAVLTGRPLVELSPLPGAVEDQLEFFHKYIRLSIITWPHRSGSFSSDSSRSSETRCDLLRSDVDTQADVL